jgi:type II secretory pathway component GspD/PulD (secretin)
LSPVRRTILLVGLVASVAGCAWLLVAQDATPPGFRAYRLRHVDAGDVTDQLDEMLSELGGQHEIVVDRTANRLLVQGSEETQRLATQLIKTLDQPPTAAATPEAPRAPVSVRGYEVPAAELEKTLKELGKQFPPSSGVRFTVDRRTSQLIVAAPADAHRRISSQLGVPSADSAAEASDRGVVRGYALKNTTWREFEDALARSWGNRMERQTSANGEVAIISAVTATGSQPVLHVDRRHNTVAFLGPRDLALAWQRVTSALDRAEDASEQDTQVVPLSRADPDKVKYAVDLIQAVEQRSAQLASAAMPQQPDAAEEEAAAPKPTQDEAAVAVEDAAEGAAESDETAPGETLLAGDEDGGLLGPVSVEYMEGLDIIVLRGHKRDVERVRKIIADIEDVSKLSQPTIEVFELKHIGSQVMSALVTEIYDDILSPRQGQVTIRPLVKPNALLLIGRPEAVELVQKLIIKLDQPVEPETQFEVFQLKYISALDAEEMMTEFFVDGLGDQGGQTQTPRPGLGSRVNIVAEYRSNSLIVQASPSDMQEVRRLIERIDVETIKSTNELRIFRLKNALATDVAPVLQDALNWQLTGRRQPFGQTTGNVFGGQGFGTAQDESARLRSAILTFMTIDSEGKKILESGLMENVRVTADANANSLIITGPAKSMGLIEVLVEQLDTLPSARAQIKVFTIVNGDATALANMLQQMLSEQAQTTQAGAGTLFGQGTINPFLQPGLQTAATLGESTLVPIRFGVDQRTNSIVVTGTEGDLGVVEAILLRLDEESYHEHKTMVYWLANAPALSVAESLNLWLDERAAIFADQLQITPESPDIQWERQVIVVAEEVSNSIIISATPELFDEVKHVVESLDRELPVVKIDVLIAEVILSDAFEFGAEFGLQDSLLFDRSYSVGGGPGYNFNNVPLGDTGGVRDVVLGQALTTFELLRESATEGYGGLVLSASRDSVSMLLRALQEDGRVQILSRPQVTTQDNQEANVFVGEITYRPGLTTQNANTTQTSVEPVEVGLQLRVTPRLRPDGTVVMDVQAVKSRIDEANAVVIDGNVIENIATVSAITTVSAQSGQTIVFAGLIQTDSQQVVRGIPYMSNLPVVGPLFSFTQDRERRTELLIIMTPHVIRDEEELDMFRYAESERMSWCLADVLEVYGNVGLSSRPGNWCPCGGCGYCEICLGNAATPVIFPDTNPTGVVEPVEIEPVPEPVPSEQGTPLLPPPVHSSSIQTTPAGMVRPPIGTPREPPPWRPVGPAAKPTQFPAMPAGYEGNGPARNWETQAFDTAGSDGRPTAPAMWTAAPQQPAQPQETFKRLPPDPNWQSGAARGY